jgi:hypothetical protein
VVFIILYVSRSQQNRTAFQYKQRSPGDGRQLTTCTVANPATLCYQPWTERKGGEWNTSVATKIYHFTDTTHWLRYVRIYRVRCTDVCTEHVNWTINSSHSISEDTGFVYSAKHQVSWLGFHIGSIKFLEGNNGSKLETTTSLSEIGREAKRVT